MFHRLRNHSTQLTDLGECMWATGKANATQPVIYERFEALHDSH